MNAEIHISSSHLNTPRDSSVDLEMGHYTIVSFISQTQVTFLVFFRFATFGC